MNISSSHLEQWGVELVGIADGTAV